MALRPLSFGVAACSQELASAIELLDASNGASNPQSWSWPFFALPLQHAVMNLPASAIEFLDAFNGAFDPQTWKGRLPLVHLYTFKPAAESEAGEVHGQAAWCRGVESFIFFVGKGRVDRFHWVEQGVLHKGERDSWVNPDLSRRGLFVAPPSFAHCHSDQASRVPASPHSSCPGVLASTRPLFLRFTLTLALHRHACQKKY